MRTASREGWRNLARQRHSKFNNTVYHLEPNSEGRTFPAASAISICCAGISQLGPQQDALKDSLQELEGSRRFLFSLRCFLHLATNRDNNLLTFELQDQVAQSLPVEPIEPEQWMRLYYQNARQVFQPTLRALDHVESHDPSLFRQLRDLRTRLSTSEFTISKDRVFLRNQAETFRSADSLFRLFTFVARHGLRLSWDAQRRLRAQRGRTGNGDTRTSGRT